MDAPRNLPASSPNDAPLEIVRFDNVHEPPPQAKPPLAPQPPRPGFSLDPQAGQRVPAPGSPALGTRPLGPVEYENLHRSSALLALDGMASTRKALAVIEVMQTAEDQSVYLLQRWECPPIGNESDQAYLQRSIRDGEQFVLTYSDPGDGTITYRLIPFEAQPLRRAA